MRLRAPRPRFWVLIMPLILCLTFFTSVANGHLINPQHGSLNVTEDGAYLVISIPASAFRDIDRNLDEAISIAEFNQSRGAILRAVNREVHLSTKANSLVLEGVMFSPEISHEDQNNVTHVVVMGRFSLPETAPATRLQINLFGQGANENFFKILITRGSIETSIKLTPEEPSVALTGLDPR